MRTVTTAAAIREYPLGDSQAELDRLIHQARFLGDLTEHILRLAGLGPGMRVLDVGCGTGDVSLLAAQLVGPEGSVLGVDRSAEALATARARAEAAGAHNIRFLRTDLVTEIPATRVDAIIGRFFLMYFPDPGAVLERLLECLEEGGIVAFQELEMMSPTSEPFCEAYMTAGERIRETMRRIGVDVRAGLKLRPIFVEAGLPAPRMLQMSRVESGADSEAYRYVEQITRTLLPLMEQTGVARVDEVGIETLAGRIREEAVAKGAVLVMPPLIGAWTRKSTGRAEPRIGRGDR
jgi:ubiquinone/menaquinone biosynthesis C-methylase UbiE